jgi:hypothetical protein
MRVWCDAYGLTGRLGLLGEVKRQVMLTVRRRRRDGAQDAAAWWHDQLQWIEQYQQQLAT